MEFDNEHLGINWSEPFEMMAPESEEAVPEDCIRCLQKCFGHSRFREMQWKIISSILDDVRDNCVIMATGYGKSLCYQFPSVYRDTITIVVSPLISLMQDQVLAMRFYNLRACFLGSAQTDRDTVFKVIDLQYNIVYVTPEYISSEAGVFLIERIRNHLTLIAIDEAHCISKWGHDFRIAYRNLSRLRTWCPSVPILAMTATATAQVRNDIIENLKLSNPQIVATGFDRPNLEFIVKRKKDLWADIGPYIQNIKIGSVIIYCISRKVTHIVADVISNHGILCGIYHAGISLKQRKQTHDDFIHDRIRVVVATIAFGMGINKPDVRLVIHYGVAKDVESYYQEVGRAGRDGLPARCLMFHHDKDWSLHRLIRERNRIKTSEEQMENLTLAMKKYVDILDCRRRYLLSYFGEDCSKLTVRTDCCDNCRTVRSAVGNPINLFSKYQGLSEDGLLDITDEAFKLLTLINDMTSRYGLRKAFLILRGSKSQATPLGFRTHSLFGSLKDKSERWLQAVGNSLLQMQMLAMTQLVQRNSVFPSARHSTCMITSKGKVWLSGIIKREPIKVVPGEEFIRLLKPKVVSTPKILLTAIVKPDDRPSTSNAVVLSSLSTTATPAETSLTSYSAPSSDIYRPLLKVRSKLASLFDAMPYLVASTRALQQLAKIQPTTMEELRLIQLDGYSEEKTERFGPVFLKVIRDYRAKICKPVGVTVAASENQIGVKSESTTTASTVHHPITDNGGESLHTNQQNYSNSNATLETEANEEVNENLQLSEDSVEISEPSPPPLIEIESDFEAAIFADWDSDDDDNKELPKSCAKIKQEPTTIDHSTDNENHELDLLIDALESEYLTQRKDDSKKSDHVVEKTEATGFENENKTDSDSDIFAGDWDEDIDDSDLTQISEQAEQQLLCDSIKSSPNETTLPSDHSQALRTREENTELNLLTDAIFKLESNQNLSSRTEKKTRIIERKTSEVFEYEDDSASDSENDANIMVSPKKRVLPSWMQLSTKRKR